MLRLLFCHFTQPSIHRSERLYAWFVDRHPVLIKNAAAPTWLVDLVTVRVPCRKGVEDPFLKFSAAMLGRTRYGITALEEDARTIASAQLGTQEHTLNTAAFKIGQLVGSGIIDFQEALDTLTTAGLQKRSSKILKPD